ncbi:beta strand repeat-containing protein [Aurantiacibacter odishensis]|uniref:beta strand repeat-containing protein n=1 Tax=Aurantiacibacter odishensis TaxID=1155476 RepID=UPI000E77271B|nr:hypothetical protein [Aurantiacibacter odishensis]
MTKSAIHARSALLRGCAPAALTLALLAAPQTAGAQAYNATFEVVQGSVTVDRSQATFDRIEVDGFDAVIDWFPNEINGAPEIFLPNGNTAIYTGAPNAGGFAILNRIQPTQIAAPAEFAGTVQAFLTNGQGTPIAPGGFVAFYSPTGILVGSTAVFEVPQLMLTTNAVDIASFTDFATGAGPLLLSGNNSSITIAPGASFTGTPEGSFFIVSSTNIDMAGDAYFNGSTAYVGALEAQLTHNSGLFDIIIPFASGSEGQAISHTGSTGGPESSGAGDNHIIYGVTSSVSDTSVGVSMLFSGNLGFDVATGATVAGGEIILSANYNVTGREIDGGLTGEGADSFFNGRTDPGFGPTQIVLDGVTATSDVTAISQSETSVTTNLGSSSFAGDLVIVGRNQASVRAGAGSTISVGEELYVSANNFGFADGSQTLPVNGGSASVSASTDGLVTVGGRSTVTANAYAAVDFSGAFVGDAAGGFASISADGGTVQLGGDTVVSASALAEVQTAAYEFAGIFTGGFADFSMFSGGTIALDGGLNIFATAFSPNLTGVNAGLTGNSQGGNISIGGSDGGGFFSITNGFLVADASAGVGDGVAAAGAGPTAQGGSIFVSADDTSTFSVEGDTLLLANGFGGNVTGGGDGGEGIGGTIDLFFLPATLFDGALVLDSYAQGGTGENGGNGTGGTNTINVSGPDGVLTINGVSQSFAIGEGGASTGAGNGGLGTGGTAQLFLAQGAQLAMNGAEMQLKVDAFGGNAGGGAGGDATSGSALVSVDEATADFAGTLFFSGIGQGGDSIGGAGGAGTSSSASLLLQIANGSGVSIGNVFSQSAIGIGGNGVSGGVGTGGAAGFVIDANSTLDLASASINAEGIGGDGTTGNGGDGIGGTIAANIDGGTVTASLDQNYRAAGEGGNTATGIGGSGTGGIAQVANVGGIIDAPAAGLNIDAGGIGGSATASGGSGGNGTGGDASLVTASGGSSTLLRLNFEAAGSGGDSLDTLGGDGLGGQATAVMLLDSASLVVVGDIDLDASGSGGDVVDGGGTGGTGSGGVAFALASDTADLQAGGILAISAEGEGGVGLAGGDGIGGQAAAGALANASLQAGGAALSSDGIGAEGGTGGNGTGGDSLLVATTATLGFTGPVALSAQGFGGDEPGGSGAATPAGGNATGGSATLALDSGAALTSSSTVDLEASANGGDSLDGAGGAATGGGAAFVAASGAVADIAGALGLEVAATGGTSGTGAGGLATAGSASVAVDGLQTDIQLGGISIGGMAIGSDGGSALGGDAAIIVSDTASLSVAGSTAVDLGAIASDAVGGNAVIQITNAAASFGGNVNLAAGASALETGGTANAGSASIDVVAGSSLDAGGDIGLYAEAEAGDPVGLGTGSEAIGGTTAISVSGSGSTLNAAGTTTLGAFAQGYNGSDATGGTTSLAVSDGGDFTSTTGLTMIADAQVVPAGDATAGSVTMQTLAGAVPSTISAGQTLLSANATGGATATAGIIDVLAIDGSIALTSLDAQSLGSQPSPTVSRLLADNGAITVTSDLVAAMTGDLEIEYANGGTILGGSAPADLTATFDITAGGTITITGDNAAERAFAASSLRLATRELQIDPQASLGGTNVEIVSLDTAARNVIGGATQEAGFTLTGAEVAAITADSLTITLPDTADASVDAELRDLNLVGSQAGGAQEITIASGGVMQIVGAIRYDSAAFGDSLTFVAGPSLQMILPDASVSGLSTGGELSGGLSFVADSLLFTTSDNLAVILSDPDDPAIPGLLGDFTLTGTSGPSSYISAGTVSLAALEYIYGQNTGDADRFGGIEVALGGAGFSVSQIDPASGVPPLRAILYGLASNSTNDRFEFDEEFFFNTVASGMLSGPFDDSATLNECVINTAICPSITPRPEDTPQGPIQNEVLVRNPVSGEQTGNPSRGYTSGFGVEFPGLFDAPLISEDERIDDPVASGGDSALYTLGAQEDENDQDDEGGEE